MIVSVDSADEKGRRPSQSREGSRKKVVSGDHSSVANCEYRGQYVADPVEVVEVGPHGVTRNEGGRVQKSRSSHKESTVVKRDIGSCVTRQELQPCVWSLKTSE